MRTRKCPESRWVTVVDPDGRPRLEMRWHVPAAIPAPVQLVPPPAVASLPEVIRAA